MRALAILRTAHRWLGLLLAAIVFVVAASGGLLLLRNPYYRAMYPLVRAPITEAEIQARSEILTSIESRWRADGIELVKFPQPGVNVYQVWLADGTEAFVHPLTADVVDRWHPSQRLPAFLFELHAHLFAERPGTVINGIAAIFVLFMALTGVVLWYPVRNGAFRLRAVVPRRFAPGHLLRSHAAVGVLSAIPIVVFVATGAVMAFYQPTARLVSGLLDERSPAEPNARVSLQDRSPLPWTALLSALDRTFPDGQTVYYSPGTRDNARLMFRKRLPGEWHPNGRSYIVIDPYTADVVQAIDARTQGNGTRLMNTVYPVHAAKVGGIVTIGFAACSAIALSWLAATGTWTYIGRLVSKRHQREATARDLARQRN